MRTVSKAELARWAGVSRAAVTKATRAGGPLYDAADATGVDVNHPTVRAWLSGHGVTQLPEPGPSKPKRPPRAKKAAATPRKPDTSAESMGHGIENFEDLTVREVVMRYGSVDGFKRFVDSLKGIADYKHRELRIRQQRGDLIDRAKVQGLVFPLIDVAFARLVSDVPESLTKQVVARVEAGGPETATDVMQLIRAANSRVLKNLKNSADRLELLKDAG